VSWQPTLFKALSIEDLGRAAVSLDSEDRVRALKALLMRVRREPALGAEALPIFHRVVRRERDGWIATLAARGVEEVEGAVAARPVWMELLGRESADVVQHAAVVTDPYYRPVLMDLLGRRQEPEVRRSVIRALGRIPHESVFPAIIGFLDDPAFRVDVIQALADQGDARAIPHLEPLVNDETEIGEFDDRGAPIRIGYLAWTAIRRFNEPDLNRHYGLAVYWPFHDAGWGDPVPQMLGGPPPVTYPSVTSSPDPPPPAPTPAPKRSRVAKAPPLRLQATVNGFQLVALVPMAFAVVEVIWTIVLLGTMPAGIGTSPEARAQTHRIDALGMIPGSLGVLAAFVIPIFARLRWFEFAALVVGALFCLPLVIEFGKELMTP
jgi:hypothetical protein